MSIRWYSMSKEDVLSLLATDPNQGLSGEEAAKRLKEDGKNTVNAVHKAPIRSYVLRILTDLTALLMLGVALLSFLYTKDPAALTMLVLLLVNYAIVCISYIRAQRLLEDYAVRSLPTVKVKRGGKLLRINSEAVVQGDILLLTAGDVLPCDCRILESDRLWVSESMLFGAKSLRQKRAESIRQGILRHEDAENLLYASTVVFGGRCKAVATATGGDTLVCRMGKNKPIAAAHNLDIIKDLKAISRFLSIAVLLPVFVLTFAKMLSDGQMIETFLSSLSYAVSVMPEQYVCFAYVILAIAVMRLAKEKKGQICGAFIKNPQAMPALSSLNALMIPMNSLMVEQDTIVGAVYQSGKREDLVDELPSDNALRVLRYAIISTGIYGAARLNAQNERYDVLRTQEERALIEAGDRFGIYNKSLDEKYPIKDHRACGEEGSLFETTLVEDRGVDFIVLRGAPEDVLPLCVAQRVNGRVEQMTTDARLALEGAISREIKSRHHPIAVASKISSYNNLTRIGVCQSELIFEGFVLMEAPLLPDVAKELRRLDAAGIRVFCYSEKESEEQRALARALGIVRSEKNIAGMSALEDIEEGVFRVKLKDFTLFEGFSGEKLQYTAELLRKEYHYKIGFLAEQAEWMPVIAASDVCFSTDDGRNISKKGAVKEKVREAFWKSGGRADYQAISHLSDVILPCASTEGSDSGVCGMAAAIRTAGMMYRNIHALLFYLTFTSAMRLVLMLSSLGERTVITPVQMLTAGLIFDFAAVFVIAFEKAGKRFYRDEGRMSPIDYFRKLLPASALGAIFAAGSVLFANVLIHQGLLAEEGLTTFVFAQTLCLSATMLTAIVRASRKAFTELRFTTVFVVYLLLIPLFVAVCLLLPRVGSLFGMCALQPGVWWSTLALPAFFFTVFTVVRKILSK